MNGVGEVGKSITPSSYLRTLDPLEAVATKAAVSQFFGPLQEPAGQANRPPKVMREPMYAKWIIGGGVALVAAAILTVVLREHLPPTMPGLYLGLGGLCVIVAGIIYSKLGSESVDPPLTPEKKAEMKAQDEIGKQIAHFRKIADEAFGEISADGRRAHLVGIGRKEWNGLHEVPIVEVKGDRIWAGVVHLVSIDLTPKFIAIRQQGLHLPTGTVYGEATSRFLLTDVMTVAHEEKKLVSSVAWDKAALIAKDIAHRDTKANKGVEKIQAEIQELKKQLDALTFEEPAGNKFKLTFTTGETLELVVADCDHPNNKSDFGFPIGGKENLEAAVQIWDAIAKACEAAKGALHSAVTSVKDGLDGYQKAVVTGLSSVHSQLASLEGVMKEVLAVLKGGDGGGAIVGAPGGTYSNGNGAIAPVPPAPPPAAPTPQPEPAKTGA